ncbi:hypothetical protein P5V15_010152 [Pogonomyrmex californicus]
MQVFLGRKEKSSIYAYVDYLYSIDSHYDNIFRCNSRRTTKCRGCVILKNNKVYVLKAHHPKIPFVNVQIEMKEEMLRFSRETHTGLKEIFDLDRAPELSDLGDNELNTAALSSSSNAAVFLQFLSSAYQVMMRNTFPLLFYIFQDSRYTQFRDYPKKQLQSPLPSQLMEPSSPFSEQAVLWRKLRLSNVPKTILSIIIALPFLLSNMFQEILFILQTEADLLSTEHPDILQFVSYLRLTWLNMASKISTYHCPVRTNNIVESFHNTAVQKLGT